MRRGVLTRLVLLACAAPVLAHNVAWAGKDNKQSAPPASPFTKDIEGKPRASQEEAIDSALQIACDEITAYLREQKPTFVWKPDPNYVRERLLDDVPERSNNAANDWTRTDVKGHNVLIKQSEFERGVADFYYQVRLRVLVNSKELEHMRELDKPVRESMHRELVKHRQLWLGKILLGFVALLTAITGYIRLEDATKGYYTAWLRLGMVGVLCAVGAGLWLTR
jgi:hypothetical protein